MCIRWRSVVRTHRDNVSWPINGRSESASAVISDVSFTGLYNGQCLFVDVVSFLGARGFGVHAFGAETARGVPLTQADVLFLRGATSS